jgi:hypothetical protein
MNGINYFKKEHWIFKIIYIIGITMTLIHLYISFTEEKNENHLIPAIGYSFLTISLIRLSVKTMGKRSKNIE